MVISSGRGGPLLLFYLGSEQILPQRSTTKQGSGRVVRAVVNIVGKWSTCFVIACKTVN